MKRIYGFALAFAAFLVFGASQGFAGIYTLVDISGKKICERGRTMVGDSRNYWSGGPSLIATYPSQEACEAARTGKRLVKLRPVIVRKPAVVKRKPAVVAVKKAVIIKKKKKKKKIYVAQPAPPPPPPPLDDTVVH